MQQAQRRIATTRPVPGSLPRFPARSPRGAALLLALAATAALVAVTLVAARATGSERTGTVAVAQPAAVPVANSDLGTAFDPFLSQAVAPRPVAVAQANSDLGTVFDPFLIQGAHPEAAAQLVRNAPASDPSSDYGTDYDPFVIQNGQPLRQGR